MMAHFPPPRSQGPVWAPSTRRALLLGAAAGLCGCAAAEQAQTIQTHIYSPHGLTLTVYPCDTARAPAVLLLHGGGWYGGEPADMASIAAMLSPHGLRPISVQYRLTEQGARWPAPAEDVRAAIWWVREHADQLDIDPDQIVGLGYSAGGHLAAWCAVTDAASPRGVRGRLNKLITLAAPWDLAYAPDARPEEGNDELDFVLDLLLGDTPRAAASPLGLIDSQTPPTLLIHGEQDATVPIAQSVRAYAAFRAANAPATLIRLDNQDHDSLYGRHAFARVLENVIAFINGGAR